MQDVPIAEGLQEERFAASVDALAADPDRREQLTDLLREDHPLYNQRGTATTVRMRGWILLALARSGVSDRGLLFLLEELDTGSDPYLVAAAAHTLRSYPAPAPALASFVMRAITNIRFRDEPVSFGAYGEYATSSAGTSPIRELLATLAWLGPHARAWLPEVEALGVQPGGLSKKRRIDVDRAVKAIRGADPGVEPRDPCCSLAGGLGHALSWPSALRLGGGRLGRVVFEDHDGRSITFNELFHGHPSIVVFFYTRCDNPLKCSLTITKLARIQQLLNDEGLAGGIHTAAITYDPGFDVPERLLGYGRNRGVHVSAAHRLLRTADGMDAVRRHFRLGVNFIGPLINRHRLEVFVLDRRGAIAASFERIHWDERQVVDRAIAVLNEVPEEPERRPSAGRSATASSIAGTAASIGTAFFPKCPVCWAAYLSVFGVAGAEQIQISPRLQPLMLGVMLVNVISVWLRGRATGRTTGFWLALSGALAIVASKTGSAFELAAFAGVALTVVGSLLSARSTPRGRAVERRRWRLTGRSTSRASATPPMAGSI